MEHVFSCFYLTLAFQLIYCQVMLLFHSWFVWWSSWLIQSLVEWHPGSSRCNAYLFLRFWISVINLSSLFLNGFSGLLHFPVSFFVILYIYFIFPSLTTFSVVVTRSSTYFCLSATMLFFTWLIASVCSACDLIFCVHVQQLLIAAFWLLFSWIRSRVSIEIHFWWWCVSMPSTSWHVVVSAYLIHFHLSSILVFSLSRSCEARNSLRDMLNWLSLSLCGRKVVLNLCNDMFLVVQCLHSFSFNFSTTKWWSEDLSAPLLVLMSSIVLPNLLLMQIWSI